MPQPKGRGPIKKQGGPFAIAGQTTPRAEDEVIVGIALGPLLPQEMGPTGTGDAICGNRGSFCFAPSNQMGLGTEASSHNLL